MADDLPITVANIKDAGILSDYYLPPGADPGNVISTVILNGTNYERWAKERFSVGNDPLNFELRSSIGSCKQEGLSIQAYYGKLKRMWDDLEDIDPIPPFCCENTRCAQQKAHVERRDKERKSQFLMGLDGTRFGATRSNILAMSPSPSLPAVYLLIQQEEKHQSIACARELRHDVVGFSAQIGGSTERGGGSIDPCYGSLAPRVGSIDPAPAGRGGRPFFSCTHCGKTSHEVSRCYQIIGYPDSGSGSGRGRGKGCGRSIPLVAGRANNVQLSDAIAAPAHTITSIDREGPMVGQANSVTSLGNFEPPFVAPVPSSNILDEDDCLVSPLTQTVLHERGSSMEEMELIAESGVADVDPVQNTHEPVADRSTDLSLGWIDLGCNTISAVDRSIDPTSVSINPTTLALASDVVTVLALVERLGKGCHVKKPYVSS
ncbi:unnamed protein product [Arabidopsis halleri]